MCLAWPHENDHTVLIPNISRLLNLYQVLTLRPLSQAFIHLANCDQTKNYSILHPVHIH